MQFSEIIGNENIKEKLKNDVIHNKISHAQLFLGKEGSGNLAMALAYAQFLVCEDKQNEACGKCSSCIRAQKLEHPDIHYSFPVILAINKTTNPFLPQWRDINRKHPYFTIHDWIHLIDEKGRKPTIGVDESQNIIKKLSLKAFEGGYKIMIIWMAEWMNTEASNKLLKIIEEPPNNTVFILVANDQESIISTIISRTQIVKLNQPSTTDVIKLLTSKLNVEVSNATTIAAMANGNLAKAIHLAENHGDKNEFLESFVKWMRVCFKKSVVGMITWSDDIATKGRDYHKSFIEYALYMIRSSVIQNYADAIQDQIPEEENQFLENFAKFITGNNVIDMLTLLSDSHYQIDRNANPKILFTDTSFQMMKLLRKA